MTSVTHLPLFEESEYQQILANELEREGVSVNPSPPGIPLSPILWYVLRDRPDVIHVHWTHPFYLFGSKEWLYDIPLSRLFCWFAGVLFVAQLALASLITDRVVWTVHNKMNHEQRYQTLDYHVGLAVARIADRIHTWDDRTEHQVRMYYRTKPGKMTPIPHGTFSPLYQDVETQSDTLPDGGDGTLAELREYDRVFLYFGMIRPYKNVDGLAEAFRDLSSDGDALLIAGKPMYEDITDRVDEIAADAGNIYTDYRFVPPEDVARYFQMADVAVYPYHNVHNSGAVLLAHTFGVAYLAPDSGAVPSVTPTEDQLFADGEFRTALARVMSSSDSHLKTLAEENTKLADGRLSWDELTTEYITLYTGK